MNESGVLRSSWELAPPTIGAAVWHTVGPTHEVRKVLMRAFGYWHYYPSDFFKPAFPLDATRVLSLAPTLPSGLRLSSKDAFMKLIRRLATLAAASGRAVAHPLVECGDVFLKDGDFIPVPCPNSKTPCCFYTKGIELPFCPRTSLVYPPEVSFLLKFLNADEHATIVTRDLYEPRDSASAGSVDEDPNTWDWISDKWDTKASSAPEGTSLKVAHDLLLNKQLVFLNVSGLSNANGDEVLRNLPAKLSGLQKREIEQMKSRILGCGGLFGPNVNVPSTTATWGRALHRIVLASKAQQPSAWCHTCEGRQAGSFDDAVCHRAEIG